MSMRYSNKKFNDTINDIKDICIVSGTIADKICKVLYEPYVKTNEENIDILSTRIGRLENVAIRRAIKDLSLEKIMEKYLSNRDINKYFRSKARLSQLLLRG